MTTKKQFRIGDKVVVNERNANHKGKKGVVKYVSSDQVWVKFEDGQVSPPLAIWAVNAS